MKVLWETPVPSTSFIGSIHFGVFPKRTIKLEFSFEDNDGDEKKNILIFNEVISYKCTYLYGIASEMYTISYDKLVDMGETEWAKTIQNIMQRQGKEDKLFHYQICFDAGPCYEFICGNYQVESM